MKKKSPKLQINRETLRLLEVQDLLKEAAGGTTMTFTCATCGCSNNSCREISCHEN